MQQPQHYPLEVFNKGDARTVSQLKCIRRSGIKVNVIDAVRSVVVSVTRRVLSNTGRTAAI